MSHVQRERPYLERYRSGIEGLLPRKLGEDRLYHYILDASTVPQVHSPIDLSGNTIVDYTGRYERLKDDFREVRDRLGLPEKVRLPHRRRAAERTDYRSYYSDAAAELVARYYAPDIEALGYSFDGNG